MLFTGLAYFAFGLMFAYEEVLREARNIMFRSIIYYNARSPPEYASLLPTYSKTEYVLEQLVKYCRIVATFMFLLIAFSFYSLRRIKIMRAVGNMKNDDQLKYVYKRVGSFTFEPSNNNDRKMTKEIKLQKKGKEQSDQS